MVAVVCLSLPWSNSVEGAGGGFFEKIARRVRVLYSVYSDMDTVVVSYSYLLYSTIPGHVLYRCTVSGTVL